MNIVEIFFMFEFLQFILTFQLFAWFKIMFERKRILDRHGLKWNQVDRCVICFYKVTSVWIIDNFSLSLCMLFTTTNLYCLFFVNPSNFYLDQLELSWDTS